MSQVIVIKIGGVASQSLNESFIKQVKDWQQSGHQILIVHGGGFAISEMLEKAGHISQKCDGLRVTAKEDMPLVADALLNVVGKGISHDLTEAGLSVAQIGEKDLVTVKADYLNKDKYGYVGQVTAIDKSYYQDLLSQGKIPLLASLAYAADSQLLNVNADYLAKSLAIALGAEQLILMTDVKGVLENDKVIAQLLTSDVQEKIDAGVITGGMIPKIESAAETVGAGVGQVLIGDNLNTGTIISEG